MTTQRRVHGERVHRGEVIGYLPSARRAEFRTDGGEVIVCDVDLSSGNYDLNEYLERRHSACVTRYGPDRPVMVEFYPAEGDDRYRGEPRNGHQERDSAPPVP